MNLAFAQPALLWALAALLLPLLIHLVRRRQSQPTLFAATRWLGAGAAPRRRIRLVDPLLLLLRLLLLAALVFWLASPWFDPPPATSAHWALVAPGADPVAAQTKVPAGARARWLAPGFPPLDQVPEPSVAVASLLREFDAQRHPDERISVIAPPRVDGFDGARPLLLRQIELIEVAAASTPGTGATGTPRPLRIALRYSAEREAAARYLRAAVAAWNAVEPDSVVLDAGALDVALDQNVDWLWWLGAELPEAQQRWLAEGGTVLSDGAIAGDAGHVVWRDDAGRSIARALGVGRGRRVGLDLALDPQALPLLLDGRFPQQLRAVLQGEPAAPTTAAAALLVPQSLATAGAPRRPAAHEFSLLIAILFALERLLASARRRPELA
jgi:hypothetical protein